MQGRRPGKTEGVFAGIGTHCSGECNGCPGFFGAENKAHPPRGYPRYIVHRSRRVNIGQAPSVVHPCYRLEETLPGDRCA